VINATNTRRRVLTWARRLGAVSAIVLGLLLLGAQDASAHVVPWTTIQLDVQDAQIKATIAIPLDDIQAATGTDLADETQTDVNAHAAQISAYLQQHFAPTSSDGHAWTVASGALSVASAGDARSTGLYEQLVTTFTLTPPAGDNGRSFNLGYDAIVEKVVTHVIVVTVRSDWAAGHDSGAYELGTIEVDTASGRVPTFHVDLDHGSDLRGFLSMVRLGVQHIQEGTDHQLFLLALLIPAPLIAARRGWQGPATTKESIRRICRITLAFTVGHSVTLALGALGLPVAQQAIEALIAVTIIVAAAHAIRPIFPGREALVAASFGLIHGLAFSETLRQLHLSGTRLMLSLLGFNLGIELMQLLIVAFVLPPLILLARRRQYHVVRIAAAITAGLAAVGWLAARIGYANPLADAADNLGNFSKPIVATLWALALIIATITRTTPGRLSSESFTSPANRHAQPTGRCVAGTRQVSKS
jgi:hypothetical protein